MAAARASPQIFSHVSVARLQDSVLAARNVCRVCAFPTPTRPCVGSLCGRQCAAGEALARACVWCRPSEPMRPARWRLTWAHERTDQSRRDAGAGCSFHVQVHARTATCTPAHATSVALGDAS